MTRAFLVVAILGFCSPHARAADGWTFALTPYLWLPNVNGTLKYGVPPGAGGSPDVGVGPNSYLENLSAVLMLAGEARHGKWSVVSDLIYLDFRNEEGNVRSVSFGGARVDANVDLGTKSSLTGLQWLLAGGYSVANSSKASVDALGGFRYLGIKATTDWQLAGALAGPGAGQSFPASGSVSRRSDLWDVVVGLRGRVRLGESPWFVPFHLDLGTGSSSFTWQGLVGLAYAFKWGDVAIGHRQLYYDQSGDALFQDFRFGGPTLGASFRF